MKYVIFCRAYDSKKEKYIDKVRLYYDGEHNKGEFVGFGDLHNAKRKILF